MKKTFILVAKFGIYRLWSGNRITRYFTKLDFGVEIVLQDILRKTYRFQFCKRANFILPNYHIQKRIFSLFKPCKYLSANMFLGSLSLAQEKGWYEVRYLPVTLL